MSKVLINPIKNNFKKTTIYLKIQSFHPKLFKKALNKIENKAFFLNIENCKIVSLPTKRHCFNVLRSPHIDKKSREQFEIKSYQTLITICFYNMNHIQNTSINFFLNYVKNSLSGCLLKTKFIHR